MSTRAINSVKILQQKIEDYKTLTKFRLAMMVVFSAGIGFLLASSAGVNWTNFAILCLGGFFITGAANTLNQVFEREYDKQMKRTADRPLAAGRMNVSEAILLAGILSVLGTFMLASLNLLTALVGVISLISYAFIYTPLKRISPISVMVGAFPGALPPLIGWIAVTGTLDVEAIVLFSIQFFWQFPHFWAIGWLGFEDYQKAGFKMMPAKTGQSRETARHCLLYALLLIPTGIFPVIFGMISMVAGTILIVLGAYYTYAAWKLYQNCDMASAKKLLYSSLFYLPLSLIVMVIDAAFF